MAETSLIDQIAPEPNEEELNAEVETDEAQFETPPTEAEAEPAAEAEPEAAEAPAATQAEGDTVPVAILAEQRQRARDAEESNKDLRDKMVRMETLFEQFQQQRAPGQAQAEPEIPDYDEDPLGNLQATNSILQQQVTALMGHTQQKIQAEQVESQEAQHMSKYVSSVRAYTEKVPDFSGAYHHLAATLDKDLEARGYDDPAERERLLKYEEGMLVGRAMYAGKDPAELIYKYAKARGYVSGAENRTESDEGKLARIEQGQDAGRTLGGPGGGSSEPTLSLKNLIGMDDGPEFDKAFEAARKSGLLG